MQIQKYRTIFGYKDRLTFGKYKGKTVEWVIARKASYLQWALENIAWFGLSVRAKKELDDALTFKGENAYDEELEQCFREAYGPWGDS